MLKACAFDLGNTLITDTRLLEEVIKSMESWLRQNGHLTPHRSFTDIYMRINRQTNTPFISHTFGELCFFEQTFREIELTSITPEQGLREYRRILVSKMQLEPDVREALTVLRERGLKTALLTNESSQRVQALFEHTNSRDLFDEVVISEEVGYEKPDPRFFQEALNRLGIEAADLVMFGDNEIADGGCKELGILFVLVTALKKPGWGWEQGTAHQPDYRIERIDVDSIDRFIDLAYNGHRAVESRRDSGKNKP
jgi:HAD superfamily hydrolase (TIGR01509 family)